MLFTLRPYRRFPKACTATDNASFFLKLPLTYFLVLGLLITLLLLSCGTASAAWVSIAGKVGKGLNEYTLYVEPDTIHRNGDAVELWALLDFKTVQTVPSPPYLSVKSRREIDCAEEHIRLLGLTVFAGHMGTGEVVYSYSDSKDQGISVEPGSIGESLWKFVCDKQ